MDKTSHVNGNNDTGKASIGSAIYEILQESGKRRMVIWNSSGKKVIELSVLMALILSIGAPILPAVVFLGVLVEAISVSFEKD